jgi:hypothetical protein
MNSLSELNAFSITALDVTDSRGSKVIFDRVAPLQPLTQIENITSTTVAVDPGIEIVEIINYTTANVRYQVTIRTGGSPLLTGSSISWASVPAGMTLTTASNVYTISGIDNVTDWNAIKSFTWTLPANYTTRPNWYLDVAVLYYDSVRAEEMVVDWEVYDEDYYYVAELFSAATVAATGLRIKTSAVTISSAMSFAMTILRAKNFTISMSSAFTMTPVPTEDMLFAVTSVSASATKFKGIAGLTISSTASVTASLDRITSNLRIPRTYEVNADRQLFAAGMPVIYNPNPGGSDSYTIQFTAAAQTTWPTVDDTKWYNSINEPGEFAPDQTTTPTTTYSYTGTLAEVNSHFASIRFLPPFMGVEFANQSIAFPTQNITYSQYKNGTLQFTTTLSLTANGDGEYADDTIDTYSISGSTTAFTWTPVNHQLKYADLNILLVGGGGGGGIGGGGAGGLVRRNYYEPEKLVYTFNIGYGGSAASGGVIGNDGGDTYYAKGASYPGTTQLTVYGGKAGTMTSPYYGGASGNPNTKTGGIGSTNGSPGVGGGGGASTAQVGGASSTVSPFTGGNGGNGTAWYGDSYGAGGGGNGQTALGVYLPGSNGSGHGNGGDGGRGAHPEASQGTRTAGGNGLIKVYVRKRQQDPSSDT